MCRFSMQCDMTDWQWCSLHYRIITMVSGIMEGVEESRWRGFII